MLTKGISIKCLHLNLVPEGFRFLSFCPIFFLPSLSFSNLFVWIVSVKQKREVLKCFQLKSLLKVQDFSVSTEKHEGLIARSQYED